MPIWVMGGAYTMLSTEGDVLEGVGVGEVGPWQELKEFGVVPIGAVETEHSELVGSIRIGA
jgi:hypothetical protein